MTLNISILSFLFKHFFSLLFITHTTPPVTGQSLTYSIIKGNEIIGSMQIDRSTKNDLTEYTSQAKASVGFIFNFKIYDKMNVVFKGNQMLQAKLYRTLNGKIKVNNTATWIGNSYRLHDKEGSNGSINHGIYLSTASLYYFEPVNISAVFSEKFQKMISIKRVGDKKYLMNLPDGNKVIYSYNNGICSLVEADTDWASVKFVLKTSTTKN